MTIEFIEADLTPLRISQEAYWNLYKSEYGVSPRFVSEEHWNDLEWLNQEIRSFNTIPEAPETSYFEDLLVNLTKEDSV